MQILKIQRLRVSLSRALSAWFLTNTDFDPEDDADDLNGSDVGGSISDDEDPAEARGHYEDVGYVSIPCSLSHMLIADQKEQASQV